MKAELDRRLDRNAGALGRLPAVPYGTSAAALIDNLTATTTASDIEAVIGSDSTESAKLGELIGEEARLKASDPSAETERLRSAAAAIDKDASQVSLLETRLGDEAIEAAIADRDEAIAARAASLAASKVSFEGEPLAGVGSESWRRMFEAARLYSEHEAYPGQDFPVTHEGSVCPLCQQGLSADGIARLERFDSFVEDTTARAAQVADAALATTVQGLEALTVDKQALALKRGELRLRDQALGAEVDAFIQAAEARRQATLGTLNNGSGTTVPSFAASPKDKLLQLASELRARADGLDAEESRRTWQRSRRRRTNLRGVKQFVSIGRPLTRDSPAQGADEVECRQDRG